MSTAVRIRSESHSWTLKVRTTTSYSRASDILLNCCPLLCLGLGSLHGIDELRSWQFEVFNEPDNVWYFPMTLYAAAAIAVIAVDTRLSVGGPAGGHAGGPAIPPSGWPELFTHYFVNTCRSARVPLDSKRPWYLVVHGRGEHGAPGDARHLANVMENIMRTARAATSCRIGKLLAAEDLP